MELYESKMLLVSFVWFCPTDERTLVLACNKGEPQFLLQITFLCIPLVVCRSEIITSESIVQHAYVLCFHTYTGYLFYFSNFATVTIQHSIWQLWLLQSPHCQISETTIQDTLCVYLHAALLGLPSFLNLGPKLDESTLNCSEYVY